MKILSKMNDYTSVCPDPFALQHCYPMQATILHKEISLALYKVHNLLKLLVSKSDLTKTN